LENGVFNAKVRPYRIWLLPLKGIGIWLMTFGEGLANGRGAN